MNKKYILVENDDWDAINAHFRICREAQVPNIYIMKGKGVYWRVAMDNIGLDQEILNFISDKMDDKYHVLLCLEKMKIFKKQRGVLSRIGNMCYYADVRREYAELFAKYLYDVHIAYINEFKKIKKFELRQYNLKMK